MNKNFCLLLTMVMSVTTMINPLAVEAKEVYSGERFAITTSDVVLECGIYEGEITETVIEGASPRIVVSKYIDTWITYDGHVIPDNNITYTVYDNDYHTIMTGNLTLKSYTQDYNALMQKETRARYTGYIYATI